MLKVTHLFASTLFPIMQIGGHTFFSTARSFLDIGKVCEMSFGSLNLSKTSATASLAVAFYCPYSSLSAKQISNDMVHET